MGVDLRDAGGPDGLLDLLGQQRQIVLADGAPWHALPTPAMIFSREKGSIAPDRLTTWRLAVSMVVKRREHWGHSRRRRIAWESSLARESMTRDSGCLQNGQRIP